MIKLKFGKPLCRSIIAVAIMMLSLQAMAYDFPYTHQGKTLYYDITGSTVEVTYYNYNNNYVSGDVVIPSTVTYNGTTYSVTSIGYSAFSGCSGLTSISIPNSVTSIGSSAFAGCSGLTSINVASGNTHYSSIDGVLYNYVQNTLIQCPCAKTSVTIPNSVTYIEERAFEDCSGLTSVTIPNSVTSIGRLAFSGCSGLMTLNFNAIDCQDFEEYYDNGNRYYPFSGTSLTTVNIGDSVQRIPTNFVRDCSGLTSVTIGTGVTSIGDEAFYGCSGLTTLNFNAINCQDFEAYYNNSHYYYPFGTSLTTVNIGDSVQRIPTNFVRDCSGLTSVTIGNSVTSIGDYAFSGCSSLTSVTIPNSVTSIGYSAFWGCSGLTSVILPNSLTSIGYSAFWGCSGLTSVTIPTGVTSIGYSAFNGCSGLTTLNFNAIDCQGFEEYYNNGHYYYPFSGTSLTTVNIGDSVQRIPANFVRNCSGLTSVTIPNSVTSIGGSAFYGCSGLTSVTIPNSVTSIGGFAFEYCSGLTTLNFNAINCQDFNYCPFIGTSLTTVNIGDSVQRIPANFVRGCSGLTSVAIPNSVTSIGEQAFSGCSGLTSVTIPNSVTSIGGSAFSGCSGLTSVTIGNSVTSIGEQAFWGCSGLTSVTIPNSVTSIGEGAFSGCTGLMTLNFNAINCQDFSADSNMFGISLTTLTIGDSVQRIPANFVRYCNALTSVTVPNSVTEVGHDAFRNCGGLIAAVLGNGVSNVGNNAFKDCSYLTYLTIGIRLERIDDSAFANCSLLTSITSLASVPPLIVSSNVFAYPNNCTVTVPCGSLEAYTEQTNRWNLLFNGRISEGLSFGLSVSANDEAYGRVETDTLSCAGRTLIATPNEGYRFLSWNDGNAENPRTVTVTSDTAFMAIFTEAVSTPTITLTVNNEAMGSASYTLDGNTAVLTATANEGYSFVIWNDGNTENPRTVTITSDTAFMAIFTEAVSTPTITLTVNDETMGSATYTLDGNTAVLTATPNEGYEFTGWNDGNTENPRTVSLTSDTAFVAIFTEAVSTPTITLTVNDETMGSASYTMDGNTAVLTATPNEGYEFIGWNDGNTENPRTVTVTSDTAFMAIFTEAVSTPTITLTVNDETMGSASYTMDGNTAVLTATANEGYEFTGWNDGNTENPRTVTVTSDTAFMAIFTEAVSTPTITLTVNNEAMGSATYTLDGNTAVLTATANEGYEFTAWNDGNTENPRTVTVTSDTAFMAIFTEAVSTPTITLTVNNEAMGSASYTLDGNTAVLTATANEGYSFVIWNDGNTENPRTVTITSDTAFMAIFSPASSLQEVNAREFALYPNPAKSFVTLEFEALKENALLQILDINGRRVRTFDLKAGVETLRIDLGDLPKGVYTVMLGNVTKKLIVE